ncbi:hypothetical protein OS242_10535 [Tumebacillus sp. DT12]|uniref:Uncharacterized protein n=1 Tax=Tumebacillus lacus TaxID=2995335 RepID=A0ABT3X0G4_9BACL|nr:hypothetical protein [Tumebacillus lacus]MCX7570399.1 hypothetical protein [Tumebacillus lacus]
MEWLWATQSLINIGLICMLWKMHKGKKETVTNVQLKVEGTASNPFVFEQMLQTALKSEVRKV